MASDIKQSLDAQWAAALAGSYKESAAEFLSSSWQGDALAVSARGSGCLAVPLCPPATLVPQHKHGRSTSFAGSTSISGALQW